MKSTLLFWVFFSFSICCFAQKHSISGIVYDEDKNVLANASVIVKNSTKGKITNVQGTFTLDVQSTDILEVSYLGFKTKEVVVGDQKEISITLDAEWERLDAVVVIAYGGNKECRKISCNCYHLGGCEEKVASTEFKRIPSEESLTSLFPNPSTNGFFQLQLDKTYDTLTVEVFNMNGQMIQTTTHTKLSKIPQINLSTQPKGMYLIRTIVDGKLLETKKAIRS